MRTKNKSLDMLLLIIIAALLFLSGCTAPLDPTENENESPVIYEVETVTVETVIICDRSNAYIDYVNEEERGLVLIAYTVNATDGNLEDLAARYDVVTAANSLVLEVKIGMINGSEVSEEVLRCWIDGIEVEQTDRIKITNYKK
jgi:uncharacterized lipoprotein YajG